jgi:hypothetical protein
MRGSSTPEVDDEGFGIAAVKDAQPVRLTHHILQQ